MKKIALLIPIALLMLVSCSKEPHWDIQKFQTVNKTIYKSGLGDTLTVNNPDSIIEYISENTLLSKTVFLYDSLNRKTEEQYYTWNDDWKKNGKIMLDYQDSGKKIIYDVYNVLGDDWFLSSRCISTNDSETGRQMDEIYHWVDNQWIRDSKIISDYDENNNCTFLETYRFVDGEYRKLRKIIRVYDTLNKCIQEDEYTAQNNEWIKKSRFLLSFDMVKRSEEKGIYEGRNDNWQLIRKERSIYDPHHNPLQIEKYIIRNGQENKSVKIIFEYDLKNNRTLEESFENVNGEWYRVSKEVSVYDPKGNQTEWMVFDVVTDEEIKSKRTVNKFNKSNNLVLTEKYISHSNDWFLQEKTEYNLDPVSLQVEVVHELLNNRNQWVKKERQVCFLDQDYNLSKVVFYSLKNGEWNETGEYISAYTNIDDKPTEIYMAMLPTETENTFNGVKVFYFRNVKQQIVFQTGEYIQFGKKEFNRNFFVFDPDNGRKRCEIAYDWRNNRWQPKRKN